MSEEEETWETWNVSLWLGNEEGYYRGAVAQAADKDVDSFREWVETDIIGLDNLTGITKDFVLRCLGRVDWTEVMSAFVEEE